MSTQEETNMMRPKIKAQWLDALRSGHFKKTTSTLKKYHKTTEPGYCCLGVLCEISQEEHPEAARLLAKRQSSVYGHNDKSSQAAMLDEGMRAYAGITSDEQRKLATRNDNGESFLRIADYIEKHL